MADLITATMLQKAGGANASVNAPILQKAANKYGIVTAAEVACGLANILNESGALTKTDEDMYYTSPEHIYETFSSHFPGGVAQAAQYARNPQKLGDCVYASIGGYARRGAGWPQLTGTGNFNVYSKASGVAVANLRAYLATPEGSADCSWWYFTTHGCAAYANVGDLLSVRDEWAGMRPHTNNPEGWAYVQQWHRQLVAAMGGAAATPALHAGTGAAARVIVPPAAAPKAGPTTADLNNASVDGTLDYGV
jgi:predicted chitinase